MTPDQIQEIVTSELGCQIGIKENATPATLLVDSSDLKKVAHMLHEDARFYFDMLSCLTAVDNGVEAGTIDLIYHLYSIPFDISLGLMTTVSREAPSVQSVADIWRTANWHEREAFDLVGVVFEGHEDLRRILLPDDWEGHPLRKDYQEQEKYHGMSVVYDRDEEN